MGLTWLIVSGVFLIASIFTSKLATDSRALSQSPSCGLYWPDPKSPDINVVSRPLEFSAQTDSATWAHNCYADADNDNCNLFVGKKIEYKVSNWTCPFADHMCYGNGTNPVRFSTGAVDARSIGINAPVTYQFNRTTVCTPLNMNTTYINLQSAHGGDESWAYHYGRTETWQEEGATWISKRHSGIGEDAFYLTK